jgi:hypothetical protein
MTRDQMISKLRQARALTDDVYQATDLPQIQLIIRHADQNLHWALWNLGQMDEVRPDLPGSIIRPKRGAVKPARNKRK